MNLIIAGSRTYTNYITVDRAMRSLTATRILSGGATGVDELGERYAQSHGIPLTIYPANWERHGKAAGPIRNEEMARNADALLLIWDGQSSGSKSMLQTAWKYKLKITEVGIAPELAFLAALEQLEKALREAAPATRTAYARYYEERTREERDVRFGYWEATALARGDALSDLIRSKIALEGLAERVKL